VHAPGTGASGAAVFVSLPPGSVSSSTTATTTTTTTPTEVMTAVRCRRLAAATRRPCWRTSLRLAASRRIWLVATRTLLCRRRTIAPQDNQVT
jgi:hypothetical protein